ncbi:MFS transporter [Rugamonas sp. DEMB1]|uniref:MFS transporter n=1 Tax=Rugamonas sp. DEMB1 TaxID=3039386 RepID=UPI0024479593|nr:MFS transporter [Rugamonas sp. DEMB1]WGG53066.1 MFS transporter [Rugamonas sp. DEMB1]
MLKKYAPFAGLCLGFFIVMMDMTTVPLMYTTLMDVFQVSPAKVAWVNNIYLICYAAFLLFGGRLGDFTNRKNIVLIAFLLIGVGAGVSGAGQSFEGVILGRALMGVGAGLLTPQSMAYISILFAKGGRGAALGAWGAIAGIATATGPVITQLFLSAADWRWVMWINIPFALAGFLIVAWRLPNDPGKGIVFLDTFVAAVYGICMAGVIVGVQLITAAGATTALGVSLLVVGASAIAILIRNEVRNRRGYILSADLWLDSAFLKTCLISGGLGIGVIGFYLPLAFLLDVRMNFGPVSTSIVMVTVALSNALVGPFAGNLSDRMEPKKIVRCGMILFAVANILLGVIGVFLPGGTLALIALCAAMVVAGAGTGLAFPPLANLALGRARPESAGRAAAFFNSTRQVLSAFGAVAVAIIFDLSMRLQLGRDLDITASTLHDASAATAYSALACFLFIALCLISTSYMARSESPELIPAKL